MPAPGTARRDRGRAASRGAVGDRSDRGRGRGDDAEAGSGPSPGRQPASGTAATITASTFHHRNGTDRATATGRTHARSVRAPQTTTRAATAIRNGSEIGTAWRGTSTVADSWVLEASMNPDHRSGARTRLTPAITAVAPSAIPRFRHSRRTTNHSRPTPGVILVSRMNAHAAGRRMPTTTARPSSRLRLPSHSSPSTGGNSSSRSSVQRRPIQASDTSSRAVQAPKNAGHGMPMKRSGASTWASGGGYLYSYSPPVASKPPLIVAR